MSILENLSPNHKSMWAPTFGDLRNLTDAGFALLRGKANAVEENAMAKVCNPGKTASIPKEKRGFLAFQSTLDRAAFLLKQVGAEELVDKYDHECAQPIPRDNLIAARVRSDLAGQTLIVNAYRTLQNARNCYIQLKDKYGVEMLSNIGSKTLSDKPRKVTKKQECGTMDAIRKMFGNDAAKMGEQVLKYLDNPAAYVLPGSEVASAEPETIVLAAEQSATA